MRVLYVEDEEFLAEAVKHNLEKQGFVVDLALDGETGLRLASKDIYDVLVLDIMLPKISGLDILKYLREHNISTPIIMLSALSEVEHKVSGLNSGADDYLAKPFKTAELVARINALARRPVALKANLLSFSDLNYNLEEKSLNNISLTLKESEILEELLKTPNKIVHKEYLLAHIWGREVYEKDNYIEVYILRLRKLLKKLDSRVKIQTIRGVGYRLTENKNV